MPEFIPEIARRFLASDFYVSLPFWGAFAVVVLCYRLVPRPTILKEWLLLLCSICMLLTLPRLDLRMLAILLGICVITYGCARLLANEERLQNPGARRAVAASGIVINVLVLAFFKYSFVQHAILRSVSTAATDVIFLIGISYTAFRAIHFILEAYKNEIKTSGLLTFLNYMLFFPAFISGPIHRYNHYCANSAAARHAPFRSDLAAGLERIVHGLFKKTVLAAIVFPYTLKNIGVPIEAMTFWQIIMGLYALALYFYFDFSGYSDLAIGSARIMGFVLPENFDYPFLKRNIQQFWAHLAHVLDHMADRLHLLASGAPNAEGRFPTKTSRSSLQRRHSGGVPHLRHLAWRNSELRDLGPLSRLRDCLRQHVPTMEAQSAQSNRPEVFRVRLELRPGGDRDLQFFCPRSVFYRAQFSRPQGAVRLA